MRTFAEGRWRWWPSGVDGSVFGRGVAGEAGASRRPSWFDGALASLRAETDEALAGGGLQVPEEPGGWWHQFVCPTHGTELLFDVAETDAHAFRCPHGCVLEGEAYRGAWLVYKHQERARTALSCAALYAAGGEAVYAEAANVLLEAYAARYPDYPVHPDAQPWMLKGRAFHQALTEAIWSTTLIRAMLLLRDAGALRADPALLDGFLSLLAESMTEYRRILIHERGEPANNYTAWLNACLASVYAARGDAAAMEALIADRGGLREHLSIAVGGDGLEFEGSMYYHLFVLRAYWIGAEMAERLGFALSSWDGDGERSLRGMLDAAVGLAAPNGELPALHDGPYRRMPYAREIAEVFEIGYARYGDSRYLPVLREAYRQLGGAAVGSGSAAAVPARRLGLEAVLYGAGEWDATHGETSSREASVGQASGEQTASGGAADGQGSDGANGAAAAGTPASRLYADAGFVALRAAGSPLSVIADFGPHGGSHGHDDKLGIVLMHPRGFALPDRGMVPYGSELRKRWFARTPSHNTVSVGGRTQAEHAGACLRFEEAPGRAYAWLRSEGAYAGAALDRHLWVDGAGGFVLDWFEVSLASAETIDYWLHFGEALTPSGPDEWFPCAADAVRGEDASYEYIEALARWNGACEGGASASPADGSGKPAKHASLSTTCGGDPLQLALSASPGAALHRIQSPGTSVDPSARLDGLVWRASGRRAAFVTAYAASSEALTLSRSADGTSASVRVGAGPEVSFRMTEKGLRKDGA